ALETPNLVWYLVEPGSSLSHEQPVIDFLTETQHPVFLMINQVDRYSQKAVQRIRSEIREALEKNQVKVIEELAISAKTGQGIPELLEKTWSFLPEGPIYYPDPDILTDRPVRYLAAELI